MKFLLANLVVACALVSPSVFAHDPKSHDADIPAATVSEEVRPALAVVEDFSNALHAGDMDRVRALLADDVLILESGGAERSREEYLSHHAIADAEFLKGTHVQIKQRTARVEGAMAWIGTETEVHATKDGKPLTLLSTETMILKRTGAEWQIVHIHWSSRSKK